MKTLKSLAIAGMIGAGIFGNVKGQNSSRNKVETDFKQAYEKYEQNMEKDTSKNEPNTLGNIIKRGEILDTLIYVYNSMIPSYNQCVKDNKDNCVKIFIPKLTTCDSLLKQFKLFPNIQGHYYAVEDIGPFTDESINQLLSANEKFYKITQFLNNNPSEKNYDTWLKELKIHQKTCGAVFKKYQ